MLTLEAVFTAVLAGWWYGEAMGRRVWGAVVLLLAGGVALVLEQGLQGQAGQASVWGLLAVLAATAAWGIDNTLSRALAERDPAQVVVAKCVLGSCATATLAWWAHEPVPQLGAIVGLMLVGRRLWTELALLPVGPAFIRCRPNWVRVRLRALRGRGLGVGPRGPVGRLGLDAGQCPDGGRHRAAPHGDPRPLA